MSPTTPPPTPSDAVPTAQPELTGRAVATGLLLGAGLAVGNLYLGLKAGWVVGVSITACVLATALWGSLHRIGFARRPMGMLETNSSASVASALAFSSGAILFAAWPALWMLGLSRPPILEAMGWAALISLLGIVLAWPLRERIAHSPALTFPSGVANAETLRGFHERAGDAVGQAKALAGSAIASAALHLASNNPFGAQLPSSLGFPGVFRGRPWGDYGLSYSLSGLSFAVGAILGLDICLWMLGGSVLAFLVLGPELLQRNIIESLGFREIMLGYALWFGAALMVFGSLTDLAFEWRVLVRALRAPGGGRELAQGRRFWGLLVLLAAGVAWLAHRSFGVAPWQSLIAIALAALFVHVAVRAMGETDIAPVGDFSRLSQVVFGGIAPARLWTNVSLASLIAGSSATACDLAERQRCTARIGGNFRIQAWAYAIGSLVGAVLLVGVFYLLIPDAELLGSEEYPAPAAQSTRAIAQLLSDGGLSKLAPLGRTAFLFGAILGIVFATARRIVGSHRAWLPSAMGMGMGMVLDLESTLSFVVGALIAWAARRRWRAQAESYTVPIGSGLIAGESLAGVLLAVLAALGLGRDGS